HWVVGRYDRLRESRRQRPLEGLLCKGCQRKERQNDGGITHERLRFAKYRIRLTFPASVEGMHAEGRQTEPRWRPAEMFRGATQSRIARCAKEQNRARTFARRIASRYSSPPRPTGPNAPQTSARTQCVRSREFLSSLKMLCRSRYPKASGCPNRVRGSSG